MMYPPHLQNEEAEARGLVREYLAETGLTLEAARLALLLGDGYRVAPSGALTRLEVEAWAEARMALCVLRQVAEELCVDGPDAPLWDTGLPAEAVQALRDRVASIYAAGHIPSRAEEAALLKRVPAARRYRRALARLTRKLRPLTRAQRTEERARLLGGQDDLRTWLRERGHGDTLTASMAPSVLAGMYLEQRRARRLEEVVYFPWRADNARRRHHRSVLRKVADHRLSVAPFDLEQLAARPYRSALPVSAHVVLVACMNLLRDRGEVPNVPASASLARQPRVEIRLERGAHELADAARIPRLANGKHDRATIRMVTDGVRHLLEGGRQLLHLWEEDDRRERRRVTRYELVYTAFADLVVEGRLVQEGQEFTFSGDVSLGLHPILFAGARDSTKAMPADVFTRYGAALEALTEQAAVDAALRGIVGTGRLRRTDPEFEFLVWCYMHAGRQKAITDENLALAIGLSPLWKVQRREARARQAIERAIRVAQHMGALERVERQGTVRVFYFGAQGRDDPPPFLPV